MTQAEAEEVLGLPERYDQGELRRHLTQLARRFHPDNAERNGIPASEAQEQMTRVNKAYATLKPLFDCGVRVVHRDLVGADPGRGDGVHFSPTGERVGRTQVDDSLFWDEDGNARGSSAVGRADAAADAQGHDLRRVLLGPVLMRVVLVALFALLWWRTFPLLGPGTPGHQEIPGLDPLAWARLSAAAIYPTYLLAYEVLTGNVSSALREAINGLVSYQTRVHVDIRRKGAYRSALSTLVETQLYGILVLPLALWLVGTGLSQPDGPARIVLLVAGAVVAVDVLLSTLGSGIASSLSHALGAAIERRYVVARMALLKRCGQWETDPDDPVASGPAGRHAAR